MGRGGVGRGGGGGRRGGHRCGTSSSAGSPHRCGGKWRGEEGGKVKGSRTPGEWGRAWDALTLGKRAADADDDDGLVARTWVAFSAVL